MNTITEKNNNAQNHTEVTDIVEVAFLDAMSSDGTPKKISPDNLLSNADSAIYSQQELIADNKALPDYGAMPLLCGQPPILFGAGTPQESILPDNWNQFDGENGYNWNGEPSAEGQQYINTTVTTGGRYIAVRKSYDRTSASYYDLMWANI